MKWQIVFVALGTAALASTFFAHGLVQSSIAWGLTVLFLGLSYWTRLSEPGAKTHFLPAIGVCLAIGAFVGVVWFATASKFLFAILIIAMIVAALVFLFRPLFKDEGI